MYRICYIKIQIIYEDIEDNQGITALFVYSSEIFNLIGLFIV